MKKIPGILFLLTLLLASGLSPLSAQLGGMLPIRLSPKLHLLPAPSLSYSPETSWRFGAALIATHKPDLSSERHISKLHLDVLYSLRKQFIVDLDHDLYLNDGRILLTGSNSFYSYPEYYYTMNPVGIADTTRELIQSKRIDFNNAIYYELFQNWYVGIQHRFQRLSDLAYLPDGIFSREQAPLADPHYYHGIGMGVMKDERSNPINPVGGDYYFNLNSHLFSGVLGSHKTFSRFELDYRHYIRIGQAQTLAFQGYAVFTTGSPSYRLMGMLGGSTHMRGYYAGRYRSRQYTTIQSELRTSLFGRIGLVLFAGVGQVAWTLPELLNHNPLFSYGTGLRIMLDTESRANLRIDYARGLNSQGWYISYGEAF